MEQSDYSTIVDRLRAAGCVFAEEEAALLIAETENQRERESLVQRRVDGFPLEYLLGWAEFYGLRIAVAPGVFVPRRRTEFLVNQALRLLPAASKPIVVDLCCGAGGIAAAIATARPTAEVHAADLDPAAVGCARQNLASFAGAASTSSTAGTELSLAQASVHQGELFEALPAILRGRVSLLVVNAPYVPTEEIALMPAEARLYETSSALDGGQDGLDIQRRVAAEVSNWIAPGGHIVMETSERQAPASAELFAEQGLSVQVRSSTELAATVIVAGVPGGGADAAE
ncbi:putative protein N(5)-glutamine methyltransferase [Psychromicrobium lacuslunae]|uniref:putative protein N(5)-glutamine methyltransferase n=1 Tax=Psychromicrobium lacuslunae TaxID=1618207 RepID=UPI000A607D32|nr:putative protein N(5)-glutamine methyltransferase [Psychromicrobium lacuslunae]